MKNNINEQGFTLLELMIALALGLVIVAAAVTLFITGQRSYTVQQGMSENQNNANFGLNLITRDVRHANLDGARTGLTDRSISGGIVLSSKANPYIDTANKNAEIANLPVSITAANAPLALLSRSNGQTASTTNNQWSGISNVTLATGGDSLQSDQLVIQYLPLEEMIGSFDCEGREITSRDEYVIQRYFLRKDTNAASTEPNEPLALACDAGRYTIPTPEIKATTTTVGKPATPTEFKNYGDAGQIIMQRVDHFRVLFGVVDDLTAPSTPTYQYVDVKKYFELPQTEEKPRPKIFAIQLGVLSRSTQSVGDDGMIKTDQKFQILDQEVKIKTTTGTPPKYVRQVVTQTIALRNASGG